MGILTFCSFSITELKEKQQLLSIYGPKSSSSSLPTRKILILRSFFRKKLSSESLMISSMSISMTPLSSLLKISKKGRLSKSAFVLSNYYLSSFFESREISCAILLSSSISFCFFNISSSFISLEDFKLTTSSIKLTQSSCISLFPSMTDYLEKGLQLYLIKYQPLFYFYLAIANASFSSYSFSSMVFLFYSDITGSLEPR